MYRMKRGRHNIFVWSSGSSSFHTLKILFCRISRLVPKPDFRMHYLACVLQDDHSKMFQYRCDLWCPSNTKSFRFHLKIKVCPFRWWFHPFLEKDKEIMFICVYILPTFHNHNWYIPVFYYELLFSGTMYFLTVFITIVNKCFVLLWSCRLQRLKRGPVPSLPRVQTKAGTQTFYSCAPSL